jgi:hypothetical protein
MILETERARNHIAGEAQRYLEGVEPPLGVIVLVFQRDLTPKISYASNVTNTTAIAVMQQVIQDRMADEAARQVN